MQCSLLRQRCYVGAVLTVQTEVLCWCSAHYIRALELPIVDVQHRNVWLGLKT